MHSSVTQRSKVIAISQNFRGCPGNSAQLTLAQSHLPFGHAKRRAKSVTFATRQKEMTGPLATFSFFTKSREKMVHFCSHRTLARERRVVAPAGQAGTRRRAAAAWTFLARLSRPCVHTGPDLRADRQARWNMQNSSSAVPPPSRDAAAPVGRPHVVGIHDAILNLVPA